MPKALIIDPDPNGHGASVRDYFLGTLTLRGVSVGPSGWTCDVESLSASAGVDKAIADGYALIIRSTTGVWAGKQDWDRAAGAGIQVVHAHGSNENVRLVDPPRLFSAVVVGGEDPADGLEDDRSYGPGLEIDGVAYDGVTVESFATPTVAAILADYYDQVGSWADARAKLRMSAIGYGDGWSEARGFGVVLHDAEMPAGLDLQPPLDIQVIVAAGSVSASWRAFQTSHWARTVVTVDGAEVYAGAGSAFAWTPPATGTYTLRLYSEDADGARSHEETFVVFVVVDSPQPGQAPAGLTAVRSADYASCLLSCEPAGGTGAYRWYRGQSRYAELQLIAETAVPSLGDTELEPGRPYVYEVRGMAGGAEYASGERVTVAARRSERLRVRPAVLA